MKVRKAPPKECHKNSEFVVKEMDKVTDLWSNQMPNNL